MIKKNNVTLGIIGGAGPLASCTLYRILIENAQKFYKACDDRDFPEIIIINFPFSPMLACQESMENGQVLIQELQRCFDRLRQLGVTRCVIACNTLHIFLKEIKLNGMHVISLIDEARAAALIYERVLVLGTESTQKAGLYTSVQTCHQNSGSQETISAIIYAVLEGHVNAELAEELASHIRSQNLANVCGAVILGCTELSEINKSFPMSSYLVDEGISVIDPLEMAAHKLLELTYGKRVGAVTPSAHQD